jgi:hypothetical protein
MTPERRAQPRRSAHLLACRVVDHGGRFVCDALVRDVSLIGARLAVPSAACVPTDLVLFDEARQRVAPARLVWRAGATAGVALQPWRALAALPAETARRLRAAYYAAG